MSPAAFIELGSNIHPERHLPRAVARLAELGSIEAVSNAYENPAIGPPGQPDFVNLAVLLKTELAAPALRRALRRIEAELGRARTRDRYAPREIDLDISLYGDQIIRSDGLLIPDPHILQRGYLAITLAELDGGRRHPETGQTLAEIAARFTGQLGSLTARADITADITRFLGQDSR